MTRRFLPVSVMLIAFLTACSRSDQEHAREQAQQAQQKTKAELKQAGAEAKTEAHKLEQDIKSATNGPAGQSADAKLHSAGAKLDKAGIIASVKAKMAADAGLSTVTNVSVDVRGSTVVLSGTVGSEDQKRLAAQAAARANGVTQVENNITVQQ